MSKKKKQKKTEQKPIIKYLSLLYMTPSQIRAKDIATLLQNIDGIHVEVWNEMNILELELSNANSVDFEALELSFSNPMEEAFVKDHNIQTIFSIQLREEDYPIVKPLFEKIVEEYRGFLCADTENFQPVFLEFQI